MDEKNITDLQPLLFNQLKNRAISKTNLVDALSDLLNISNDAVYRRMRGEKRLDIDELSKICTHFNISFDTLAGFRQSGLQFSYVPLALDNTEVYRQYMKHYLKVFSNLAKANEKEVFFAAIDIPMFHFLPFTELTLFKVFAWSNSTGAFAGNFGDFCNRMKDDELIGIYKELTTAYSEIPSVEIWTEGTFDAILRLIDYYFESGHFTSANEALLLCSQLLEMIERIKSWSNRGLKDNLSEQKVGYTLYLCGIELENNFVIIRQDGATTCLIKLYTINSMATTNPDFCNESMKWISNAIQKSTLISGGAQKESFKFFNTLTQKVRYLIDRIERNKNPFGPLNPPY